MTSLLCSDWSIPAVVDVLHADGTVVVRSVSDALVTGEGVVGQTQATGGAVLILATTSDPDKT